MTQKAFLSPRKSTLPFKKERKKEKKEARMSIHITYVQHCIGGPSQWNNARKKWNKRYPDWNGKK